MTTDTDLPPWRGVQGVAMAAAAGLLITLVATGGFGAYGWLLFVGVPFFIRTSTGKRGPTS